MKIEEVNEKVFFFLNIFQKSSLMLKGRALPCLKLFFTTHNLNFLFYLTDSQRLTFIGQAFYGAKAKGLK